MSVAASAMSEELGFSTVQMGLIFSAFGWTYVALQVPGGIMVDKIKARALYTIMLFFWSVATLFQGIANSVSVLLGLRASIGIFEAPSYPTNNAVISKWFPENERATAIGIYTSGQFVGLAFLFPILVMIQDYLGWRGLFITSGILGIFYAGIWYWFYRDPMDHGSVSHEELDFIRRGGGVSYKASVSEVDKFKWTDLMEAFKHRKLWGVYIGQFCIGSTTIFFLTWFPTYLVEFRGFDFIKSGLVASVPYLAAFLGILVSGFLSDYLVKRGKSMAVARKTPVLIGLALAISIIGANYTDSKIYIILFLSLAFFGNGLSSITWVFISAMAPNYLIGRIGGVFNLVGGLTSIVIPIVIGYLVKDGDFSPALFLIGALTVVGFISYLFIVGKVEMIKPELNKKEGT